MSTIKSLKDSLLECSAMNFREVFYFVFDDITTACKLPPGLFEEIILKGRELKWNIHPTYLMKCLPLRDVLRWENIDITSNFTSSRYFDETKFIDDIENVMNLLTVVDYPLRTLSIHLEILSEEEIKNLCKLGSKIECLSLTYRERPDTLSTLNFPKMFPKLKRLALTYQSYSIFNHHCPVRLQIDLRHCADTLEELSFRNETIDKISAESMNSLTKLKVLSLENSTLPDLISKSLNLSTELLETLVTIYFERDDLMWLKQHNRLKKLKVYRVDEELENTIMSWTDLVCYEWTADFKALMKYDTKYRNFVQDMLQNLHRNSAEDIEKFILKVSEEFPSLIDCFIQNFYDQKQMSDEFIKKMININFSRFYKLAKDALSFENILDNFENKFFKQPQVIRIMLEMIRRNLNKSFTKKLLENSIFISYIIRDS